MKISQVKTATGDKGYRQWDEYTYECDLCDRLFRTHQAVNAHRRVHVGAKCHKCGETFEIHGQYYAHMAQDHAPVYRCGICGLTDETTEKIIVHILAHDKFKKAEKKVLSKLHRDT